MQGDQSGESGGEGRLPDDHHRAFHELTAVFTGADRPRASADIRERLGESYEFLPDHVRDAIDGMSDEEVGEIGRIVGRLQDRGLAYELPGGRVCLL